MKNNFNLKFLFSLFVAVTFGYTSMAQAVQAVNNATDALGTEQCGTMPGVMQRIANDPAYAAIYNQHQSNLETGLHRSLDPCATPITIPLAFHFDASFSCSDPECLTGEVQEAIDALNAAFGDNTQTQLVQDLNAACPAGYPLADISTGTCINFCLAEPRVASSNQGLDAACDPAITIGSFCGGRNFCAAGGTPPYYSGILNVFIVADDGSGLLGVADGIPGIGNGDGVTVLGSVFGADGGGCISGGPLNTSGLFGGGATLAHEVGHYLGLFHIWGDDGGACAGSDQISDTPNQADNNGGLFPCPTVAPGTTTCADLPMSCNSNDYYHNFMDYTSDNCLVMFTQEQAQVMNQTANAIFGNSTAVCYADPLVLTSLCEQTVCDPACDFVADISAECDADGANYTVTVTISGGTGPFDINETADNDPLTVETVLATALTAGTYMYSFPAGTNSNIVVVDNGIAGCFDGQFLFNPCAMCDFTVEFDYDNVTCNDFGGTLLPTVPIIVTPSEPGVSVVWIDQDGNTTFDADDIEITNGGNIGFPTTDLTFIVYDSGAEDCFATFTVESGNFSCEGVAEGGTPLRVCTFEADADLVDYTCNGDGTATVSIKVDKIAGNLTVVSGGATQVSAMADSAEYVVTVPVGASCASTTVTFADDGSDVSMDSGVSITAPSNIANMITSVGYNDNAAWGIDIATVIPPVCGTLAAPDDGTDPATDFCEPAPPATPTAAQCAALSGNIAIIDRGTCTFTTKAENAQACGATAVVICNNDAAAPDALLTMAGTSIGPVTIPTIFLSYNQCQQIYANLTNGPVDMCIGAPMDVPCERTVNIDACALVCDEPGCTAAPSTISTTDLPRICVDGIPDPIDVTIDVDGEGTSVWVVTDPTGFVFDTYPGSPFDFDNAGPGICLIWLVNSDDPNIDFVFGDDINTVVANTPCTFVSNSIAVDRIEVTSATISTTDPLSICVDDGTDEPIDVNIDNAGMGVNGAWVITDATTGTILALPAAPPFILDGAGVGSCSIWWVNYDDPNFTPAVGDDAAAIVAAATCAVLSNPITIARENCDTPCSITMGSTISTTDPTRICVDGIGDPINVSVDVDAGGTGIWVITDAAATILALPPGPPFDLDGAGPGTCLIWYANTEDGTFAPAIGDDAAAAVAASDCTELSNPITVDRIEVIGAAISSPAGDPITICTTDGIDEPIDVTIDDAGAGANGAWVITDSNGIILALPAGPPFTLDGAGPGTCLIWWVNFDDPNFAPAVGDDAGALVAAATCAALSNPITVNRDDDCGPCEDSIAGSVSAEDTGCSAAGIEVTIYDATGAVVGTATTDASGNYALMGLYPCGSYTAELTANVPDCYINSGGIVGPASFVVDGDGTADGFNFIENPQIPTLSQWGLISLALLLMIIGSLKMTATRIALQQYKVK